MTAMSDLAKNEELTRKRLRRAFAQFPSGVVAVCAMVDGEPTGMSVSTFVAVSLEPPLVGIFLANDSNTWRALRASATIGVSVLGSNQAQVARSLSGPSATRFRQVDIERNATEALFVHGSPLWLQTVLADEVPTGDHQLALLRVVSATVHDAHSPLLFHRSQLLNSLMTARRGVRE